MTIKFKAGDVVRLIEGYSTAKSGATATVQHEYEDYNTYVYVTWDKTNPLRGTEPDGGYRAFRFELLPLPKPQHNDEHVIMLFEDGKYKPASTPKVLKSKSQAVTVADTMAKAHPGSEFVVFRAVAHAKAPILLNDIVTVY